MKKISIKHIDCDDDDDNDMPPPPTIIITIKLLPVILPFSL